MDCDRVQEKAAAVAGKLPERTDKLGVLLGRAVNREVRNYQSAAPVPFDAVADGCAANMLAILSVIAGETGFGSTARTELGVARARDGDRDGDTAVDCDGGGKLLCSNVTLVCEEI